MLPVPALDPTNDGVEVGVPDATDLPGADPDAIAPDLDDEDEDEEDEDDEEEVAVVAVAAPKARPSPMPGRPSPGRPPSAKDEPPPPYNIGERVQLISNTRPRTGTPIGDYPVGAEGRVETVLSQTAIVRFDLAPDTKEVVAFSCLDSLDPAAVAQRAEEAKVREAAEGAAARALEAEKSAG
ncbi:MAG: hypothetical protein NVSMB29_01440 [Candidatus Dormibacteria bacterium]